MSGRDLTTAMSTGLQARVVRPVLIGRLDIASDPVTAWLGPGIFAPTGTGDTALDGQTFDPLGPFVGMDDIKEDQGIGGPVSLVLTGEDLDMDLLRQVVRDKREWRGRKAWLWLGLLDEDQHSVIADPVRIKTGVMTKMEVQRNKNAATVTVTIDEDLGNARSAPFRWVDLPRLHSSDDFSAFVTTLSNKQRPLTSTDVGNITHDYGTLHMGSQYDWRGHRNFNWL